MKTIIHEGVKAKVMYTIAGDEENAIELEFQVLPFVGETIKISRHGGYFSSVHVVTKVEHEAHITDSGSIVSINIYTTPEE